MSALLTTVVHILCEMSVQASSVLFDASSTACRSSPWTAAVLSGATASVEARLHAAAHCCRFIGMEMEVEKER